MNKRTKEIFKKEAFLAKVFVLKQKYVSQYATVIIKYFDRHVY